MKKKTVAIIPAFNEEKTISAVINNLKSYVDRVIVVDDFSTDKTYKIAIKSNAITLRNKKNLGPDKSIEVGLKKAKKLKYEFILTFDADDQHPHSKIPFFLKGSCSFSLNHSPLIVIRIYKFWAVSSAVERLVYTERVSGSNPLPPTTLNLFTHA